MKIASLLAAAALVLTSAAIADAAPAKPGAKAPKHRAQKVVRPVSQPAQNPDKAWWNDPSRQGFPSYSRDVR